MHSEACLLPDLTTQFLPRGFQHRLPPWSTGDSLAILYKHTQTHLYFFYYSSFAYCLGLTSSNKSVQKNVFSQLHNISLRFKKKKNELSFSFRKKILSTLRFLPLFSATMHGPTEDHLWWEPCLSAVTDVQHPQDKFLQKESNTPVSEAYTVL